ncbi:hypothetical protein L083_2535 [Actinoplanes sp. N902-109]|nr:hypothetical protein L083_2535 [Actinoplanes sp. N902-109]
MRLPEGAGLTMVTGAPVELLIALSRPHPLEVEAVTAAPTQFGWVDAGAAALLVYRLGPVLPWAQVAFHPQLMAADAGVAGVDGWRGVRIVLVDRDSRVVQAVHQVRWPDTFTTVVRKSVERMREEPYDRLAHRHALAALHRRYPTPDDLVIDRVDARCTAVPGTAR